MTRPASGPSRNVPPKLVPLDLLDDCCCCWQAGQSSSPSNMSLVPLPPGVPNESPFRGIFEVDVSGWEGTNKNATVSFRLIIVNFLNGVGWCMMECFWIRLTPKFVRTIFWRSLWYHLWSMYRQNLQITLCKTSEQKIFYMKVLMTKTVIYFWGKFSFYIIWFYRSTLIFIYHFTFLFYRYEFSVYAI